MKISDYACKYFLQGGKKSMFVIIRMKIDAVDIIISFLLRLANIQKQSNDFNIDPSF